MPKAEAENNQEEMEVVVRAVQDIHNSIPDSIMRRMMAPKMDIGAFMNMVMTGALNKIDTDSVLKGFQQIMSVCDKYIVEDVSTPAIEDGNQ